MIIDCIADLHGHFPKLEGGDLLIVAGDLTARDTEDGYYKFNSWICDLDYKKKIVIAGNHDNLLQKNWSEYLEDDPCFEYLCDSGTEFEGLKIWGSPWTAQFPGINPKCCAFTVNYGCDTEEWLAGYWAMIPDDVDILITHGPSKLMHDKTIDGENVGSSTLLNWVANHYNTLKLHVYGHIHEGYGIWDQRKLQKEFNGKEGTVFINCSHVNERYEPVNKPVRVIL